MLPKHRPGGADSHFEDAELSSGGFLRGESLFFTSLGKLQLSQLSKCCCSPSAGVLLFCPLPIPKDPFSFFFNFRMNPSVLWPCQKDLKM